MFEDTYQSPYQAANTSYNQDFISAQKEYRRNKFYGDVTADAENRMNQAMANSWNQEAANQWSAQQAALRNAPEENPLQGLHQKYVLGPSRGSNILSSDDPDGSKRAAARERYNQFATGNGTLGTEDQFLNDPRVMAMTAPQRDQAFQMMYGKTPQQYSEVKHYGDIFNATNQDKINAWNKQREALVAENSQFGPQRQDLNQRILDLNAAGQPLRKQFDYNDLARLGADHKRALESLKQFEEQTGVPFLQARGMYKDGVLTIPAKTKDDGYGNMIQIAPERKIPVPQAYMDSVAQQFNLLNPSAGIRPLQEEAAMRELHQQLTAEKANEEAAKKTKDDSAKRAAQTSIASKPKSVEQQEDELLKYTGGPVNYSRDDSFIDRVGKTRELVSPTSVMHDIDSAGQAAFNPMNWLRGIGHAGIGALNLGGRLFTGRDVMDDNIGSATQSWFDQHAEYNKAANDELARVKAARRKMISR